MPISSFMGLETSLRGLLAQQRALDVTTHNIANADRAGYTRQTAVLAAAPALSVPGALQNGATGQLGQGVDVQAYQRLRDAFADLQYRAANMTSGDGWRAPTRSTRSTTRSASRPTRASTRR